MSLLNCRLSEASLGCSITIEHEKIEWQEGLQCNIRFHGQHSNQIREMPTTKKAERRSFVDLSPIFPLEMSRDGRMQTNFVFKDVGEVQNVAC